MVISSRTRFRKVVSSFMVLTAVVLGGFVVVVGNMRNTSAEAVYREVFSDDFERSDGRINAGVAVGEQWVIPGLHGDGSTGINNVLIESGKVRNTYYSGGSPYYWGSAVLAPTEVRDGKIVATVTPDDGNWTNATVGFVVQMDDDGSSVIAEFGGGRLLKRIVACPSGSYGDGELCKSANDALATYEFASSGMPATAQFEIIVSGNVVTYTVYDANDISAGPVFTFSYEGIVSKLGKWGFLPVNKARVDDFVLHEADEEFVISGADNVQWGDDIVYTFSDDSDVTISDFSDGGAGGTFSVSSVELNAGNSYSGSVTYTPSGLGQFRLTANIDNGEVFDRNVGVWPYKTKIGFIGDSITQGATSSGMVAVPPPQAAMVELGIGFNAVNKGIGGSTSRHWAEDDKAGVSILTDAKNAFASGVEIVHLSLGANDIFAAPAIEKGQYKDNIQSIMDELKGVGVKHVILSDSAPYKSMGSSSQARYDGYAEALDELVKENKGFALRGDNGAASDYMTGHPELYDDEIHHTDEGALAFASFWATAIRDNLLDQTGPDAQWKDGDSDFQLGESGVLTYQIEKNADELIEVYVDGNLVDTSDYTIGRGSTLVTLKNAYLNGLSVGNHEIRVSFYGGVFVKGNFTIMASSSNPTSPGAPGTGVFSVTNDSGSVVTGIGAIFVVILCCIVFGVRKMVTRGRITR